MKKCISTLQGRLNQRQWLKEWVWFFILWLGGLVTAVMGAYPIKILVRYMSSGHNHIP